MILRVSFNPQTQLWKIRPQSGGDCVLASRLILDAPAKSNGGFLEVRDCELKVEGYTEVGSTVTTFARIIRHKALPGTPPKHDPQLEWCVLHDPNTRKWYAYRQDDQKVVVSTMNLEMDCHAITSKGVWHCHAEQLVNGATNKDKAVIDAQRVKLRTLKVYDQTIVVDPISMRPMAKSLRTG
jgi:hypothetical protein